MISNDLMDTYFYKQEITRVSHSKVVEHNIIWLELNKAVTISQIMQFKT